MSDGGREHKGKGPAGAGPRATVEDPTVMPQPLDGERGAPLSDPMRYVRYERAQAAAQIQHSLKAWRKQGARGDAGGGGGIPRGGGAPLPDQTRQQMQQHLGPEVGQAKIHTGSESAKAAEQMGARAFTVGGDVHFGAGEFAPGTKEGDRLLAHELTHVAQAGGAGVQRKAEEGEGGAEAAGAEVSQPHEPAEKEADSVADHVAEQIHGGGDKAAGDKAAGDKGAKPQPAQAAPKVAAKLRPGVIHRNDKGTPPAATPATGKPATPAGATPATPATAPGTPATATPGTPATATPGTPAPATPATAATPAPYDAKPRKPDELWTDCADTAKRAAAVAELVARGYVEAIVTKILSHDNGKSPRAFVSVAAEDNHTQDRHILDGAGTIPDKKALALRVLRNDPPCPGKAGAFTSSGAADKGVAAALKSMPWPTLRDKLAKGETVEEDLAVAATGEVLSGAKVQAKELPPYAHPLGEGGRPLYAGDPEFEPEMKKLEDPPGSGKYFKTTPGTKKKAAEKKPIAVDKSNPLTVGAAPTGVHVRIVANAGREGGWFIHSAWPY